MIFLNLALNKNRFSQKTFWATIMSRNDETHFFGCDQPSWVSVQCACEVEYQCTVHVRLSISAVCMWGWVSVHCAFEVEYQCSLHVRLSISAVCMWGWKPPAAWQFLLSAAFRPDQNNPAPCTCCIFSPFCLFWQRIYCILYLYSENGNIVIQNFHFAQLWKRTANHCPDKEVT